MGRPDRRCQRANQGVWRRCETALLSDSSAPAAARRRTRPSRTRSAARTRRGATTSTTFSDESSTCRPSAFRRPGTPNPFIRYRTLLHAYHLAMGEGLSDQAFCSLVRELDDRVAAVDGHGFSVTPFAAECRSSATHSSSRRPEASGSRTRRATSRARTRPGTSSDCSCYLEVAERLGLAPSAGRPELAIASCGNAALAAAVVAAAGRRALRVFVPGGRRPARPHPSRGARSVTSSCAPGTDVRAIRPIAASCEALARGRSPVHLSGQPERARRRGRRDARVGDRLHRHASSTDSSCRWAGERLRARAARR